MVGKALDDPDIKHLVCWKVRFDTTLIDELFLKHSWLFDRFVATWVCLKIGYIPSYSHLIGIMISKTIGFFLGTQHFQTHPYNCYIGREQCDKHIGDIMAARNFFNAEHARRRVAWSQETLFVEPRPSHIPGFQRWSWGGVGWKCWNLNGKLKSLEKKIRGTHFAPRRTGQREKLSTSTIRTIKPSSGENITWSIDSMHFVWIICKVGWSK
jgi:hypothetical protein